ncbi:MAG: slipin family protein [Raoultibacter sp.]
MKSAKKFNQANHPERSRGAVVAEESASRADQLASSNGALIFAVTVFVVVFSLVLGVPWLLFGMPSVLLAVAAAVLAWLATSAVHIVHQWEKVVVLRFGRFNRVSGPGLVFTVPIIEYCTLRIDQRVRATAFGAKETLTADLVPLDVDAALFWMVWDAEKACTEVGDFNLAVELSAQTALRDAIGRGAVAEIALRRNQLDKELKRILEEKVAPWGVTILSVEIRDILVPDELQDAMSLEAQAEQRKKARIILMEAEQDICEMMDRIGEVYQNNESALKLRTMHLLYESVRETGGTVVIPSAFAEGFGKGSFDDLGSLLGK